MIRVSYTWDCGGWRSLLSNKFDVSNNMGIHICQIKCVKELNRFNKNSRSSSSRLTRTRAHHMSRARYTTYPKRQRIDKTKGGMKEKHKKRLLQELQRKSHIFVQRENVFLSTKYQYTKLSKLLHIIKHHHHHHHMHNNDNSTPSPTLQPRRRWFIVRSCIKKRHRSLLLLSSINVTTQQYMYMYI